MTELPPALTTIDDYPAQVDHAVAVAVSLDRLGQAVGASQRDHAAAQRAVSIQIRHGFDFAAVGVDDRQLGLCQVDDTTAVGIDLDGSRQAARAGRGDAAIPDRAVPIEIRDRDRQIASCILGVDLDLVEHATAGRIAVDRDRLQIAR